MDNEIHTYEFTLKENGGFFAEEQMTESEAKEYARKLELEMKLVK